MFNASTQSRRLGVRTYKINLNLFLMKRTKTLMFATWELFRNWYAYIKLSFTELRLRLARFIPVPGLNQKVLVVISY